MFLIKDLLYILSFPFFGALAYLVTTTLRQEYRSASSLVIVVFAAATLLAIWSEFPFLYDYVQYLWQGSKYTQEAVCQITDVHSGTAAGLLMARQRLYCADGREFVTKHRRDFQRMAWRWAQANLVLYIRYLPRSSLVLEAVPVE